MNEIEYIRKLNDVLKDWLNTNEKIIGIENTKGGIANKVLKINTNKNNSYIFKIYQKKRNQKLPFELMKYLQSVGVNVIMPLNKEPIIFENTNCYIYEYVKNYKTTYNNELKYYLIDLLKKISNFNTKINDLEYYYTTKCNNEYNLLITLNNPKLDKELIISVLKKYEVIKEYPINNEKYVVHSDISTSNLLTTEKGYYLIDFDEVRFTTRLYDLAVILVKFFFKGKEIDIKNAKEFIELYLSEFNQYTREDCYKSFEYYVIKQLLEKITDYEIYNIDLYSYQQQQDDFRNWIYYFLNMDKIEEIFKG